ncbi:MAG: hypothetical protein N4Q30_07185, partial [Neisseriaceae bacterium]|nr:hypothetical protein [Neisseriaceae bacterium]
RTGEVIPEFVISKDVIPANGSRLVFKKNDGTKVEMGYWDSNENFIVTKDGEVYLKRIKESK